MDVNKVLLISQEIDPYLPQRPHALHSRKLAQGLQENGIEVRSFMPRFGAINERRNQLHEVIRLSGVNIPIDDADHPLIIKVATLQPTRLQVYFIDNDDYFHRHLPEGQIETELDPALNDERAIFFVHGVAETVKKLRWESNVVHANGWISGLVPIYIKTLYNDSPAFINSKVVYEITDDPAIDQAFDPRFADKLKEEGFSDEQIKDLSEADHRAIHHLAIDYADAIIIGTPNPDPTVMEYAKASGKPLLEYPGELPEAAKAYAEFYRSL